MSGGAAGQIPYQEITTKSDIAGWKKPLYGFTKDAPEYSPFKALSRQAGTQAKMIEGMTSRPSWSAMYEAFGVPQGQDLTPYIQAMRTGTQAPQAPIPASPAAGTIPEFTAPSEEAPKKEAAQGGLMSLRKGYAKGGLTADQANFLQAKLDSGKKISKAYQKQLDAYNKEQTTKADTPSAPAVPLSQAMNVVTPFYDPSQAQGQYGGVTNPIYQQALDQLRAVSQTPAQFGQATGIMQGAADRLMGMANYTPEQVSAQLARSYGYDPNVVLGGTGYAAMQMNAPRDIKAQGYTAEEAQAAQMLQPEDVQGQTYQAANIAPTQRETAQQIGDIGTITGQGYSAAQMAPTRKERASTTAAPKSWTDQGTAAQYMSPYMQNVVDIQKRESMRDYGKQLAQLNAQAAKSKAYGGSRQAIERSEAARGQAQRLSDIEAQGLQQAYGQGIGQFQAEQQLGSQVGMSNTAQINQLKSQYMQMGMTEAQANQAAINQAAQFSATQGQAAQTQNVANQLAAQQANAQMVNQLKSQYMQMGLTEAQANQAAQNQAAQFGAQSAQQAALANQQAGLTTGQANLSAEQQTALANQQAINQQRSQYVTQALQAATTSYGGQLTAAQQNQIAANAAAQYNSQNQQQINMVDQAARNAALQFYAAAQNTASQQYAQNQLQAAIQNQQAGLTAQGLNLQALNQAGQMGQGIGALGTSMWGQQQNIPQLWGAAGQTVQNLAQQSATGAQQTAQNWWGGMANAYAPVTNMLSGTPGTTGTQSTSRIPQ